MEAGYFGADRRQRLQRQRIHQRWADAYAPIRHLDLTLVLTALALGVIGVAMVYSATHRRLELANVDTAALATRQAIHLGVGLAGMLAAAIIDYRYARVYAPVVYVVTLLLLGLVFTPLGTVVHGSRSWISLGPLQLQPAELAKIGVVMAAAALLHEPRGVPRPLRVAGVVGLVALPGALVVAQPDIGTFLVFPWVGFVLLVVAGTRLRDLLAIGVVGAAGLAATLPLGVFGEEQLSRISTFMNPNTADVAETAAYNAIQSMIAVGSGGLVGKGFLQGTQTSLSYVPENHTDFIFTVVGEEFGFVGAMVVLGLFAVLLWRGLRIAALAKDRFGMLLAAGAVAVFVIHLFVNVGMAIGIMPIAGIPLLFVSYGGTSVMAGFVLVGLLLNVHMRRF